MKTVPGHGLLHLALCCRTGILWFDPITCLTMSINIYSCTSDAVRVVQGGMYLAAVNTVAGKYAAGTLLGTKGAGWLVPVGVLWYDGG